ncbi:hypothetical protein P5V15_003233 [Pogonomyrmex californicus]
MVEICNVFDKTVMIIGAPDEMGYKYAETLLRNGAKHIAIIGLLTSNGQNAASTLEKKFGKNRALFIACDITKSEDLEKTFKKVVDAFGGLDILINNAVAVDDDWEQTFDVNFKAQIRSCFLAMDYMGRHKDGRGGIIVNIASAMNPSSSALIYISLKNSVLGFSQLLANVYDSSGIRVMFMCPDYIETKMVEDVSDKMCNLTLTEPHSTNVDDQHYKYLRQSADQVAFAILVLIQRNKNGTACISKGNQTPYVVNISQIFQDFSLISQDLSRIFQDFSQISQDFNRIFQDFSQISQDFNRIFQDVSRIFQAFN